MAGRARVFVAMVIVVCLAGLLVVACVPSRLLNTTRGGVSGPRPLAPASVLGPVTQADSSVFAAVGAGGLTNPFKRVSGADLLTGPGGKPEVFYAGAEYCPFCATERWSIIMALSRFGTFQDLHLTTSSSIAAYPNTPTITFFDSSYSSQAIYFSSVELQDRDNHALQTPTPQQNQILTQYNSPQYLGQSAGGIPFISIGDQYITNGSSYSPGVLSGLNWQGVASKLSDPHDLVTQDIVGTANYLTAAICQITKQTPDNVCKAAPIPDIETRL